MVDVGREAPDGLVVAGAGGLDRGGAVASDFETDVPVGSARDHVELDPGGGEDGAALDVPDETGRECDDLGALGAEGDGFDGIRDDGPFPIEDGEGLGVGGFVLEDEAGASAWVRVSGFEEGFEGAGQPWTGVLGRGWDGEGWSNDGGKGEAEGEE